MCADGGKWVNFDVQFVLPRACYIAYGNIFIFDSSLCHLIHSAASFFRYATLMVNVYYVKYTHFLYCCHFVYTNFMEKPVDCASTCLLCCLYVLDKYIGLFFLLGQREINDASIIS